MKNIYLLLVAVLISTCVRGQCTASLSATQRATGNTLLNVDFADNSTYGTMSSSQFRIFQINYGDGSSNSGTLIFSTTLPSHVYAATGTYTVSLTISKWDSSTKSTVCSNSTTLSLTVAYPACGTVVSSTGSGATQTFSAVNPAGTSGISHAWNFGDGTTGTGATPVRTYSQYGIYYVGCSSSAGSPASCTYANSLQVTIAPPVSPASINCALTQASFTATVGGGGSYVNCSNTSTLIPNSPTAINPYLTKTKWDFGDGTISYSSHAGTHYYAATGTYTITLDMEWVDSNKSVIACKKTATTTVTITSVASATIDGEVVWDSLTYKGPAYSTYKVWLIQFNPITNILSALDSQITTLNPSRYGPTIVATFSFPGKPPGNYLLKAALVGGASSGTGIVPTYSEYSSLWSTAKTISVTNGSKSYDYIYMNNGTLTAGPGFIGGNVSLGANKGGNAGVGGLPVFLLKTTPRQVVRMAITDASGNFSFSNFPAGNYSVYPELLNYATTPAVLNIAAGNTNVIGVSFFQDDVKKSIKPISTVVASVSPRSSNWCVFPNPARQEATITWQGNLDKASTIVISDVTGKAVMHINVSALKQGKQVIDLRALSQGLYLLNGTGALAGAAQKLIVE